MSGEGVPFSCPGPWGEGRCSRVRQGSAAEESSRRGQTWLYGSAEKMSFWKTAASFALQYIQIFPSREDFPKGTERRLAAGFAPLHVQSRLQAGAPFWLRLRRAAPLRFKLGAARLPVAANLLVLLRSGAERMLSERMLHLILTVLATNKNPCDGRARPRDRLLVSTARYSLPNSSHIALEEWLPPATILACRRRRNSRFPSASHYGWLSAGAAA